jgi:hypothetical protein
MRKREERRKEREAAAARQAAADAELREKLIAGCYGNYIPGPGLDDMAPVRAILKDDVPLEHILTGLMRAVDRRMDPQAAPIASWRDERFLREVARCVLLEVFLPRLAATWAAAGTAPGKPADASQASAGTREPAAPQTAPAVPQGNGSGPPAPNPPESPSRIDPATPDTVLDAFRNRIPPQPRPPEREAEAFDEATLDEMTESYAAGLLAWNSRRMGPAPDDPETFVPEHIRRKHGF